MTRSSRYLFTILLMNILFVVACTPGDDRVSRQYEKGEIYPPEQLYAVVEVPAGTSVLRTFDFQQNKLVPVGDTISFLPYPGNYGFMLRREAFEQELSRDDHLSCLVLSSSLRPQEILPVYTVGVLILEKDGKRENIIMCVPESSQLQTIPVTDFVDFMTRFDPVRFQLQHWFANFQGQNTVRVVGWEDEHYAERLIE